MTDTGLDFVDKRYRVSVMGQWPRIYPNLLGAIAFLMERCPLWYYLEVEVEPDVWAFIATSQQTRLARFCDYKEDTGSHNESHPQAG